MEENRITLVERPALTLHRSRVVPQIIKERVLELRRKATRAEQLLFDPLMHLSGKLNLHITFQCPVSHSGGYAIIDFYSHAARLGIELDGKHHLESKEQVIKDKERSRLLKRDCGITIIRLSNPAVIEDPFAMALGIAQQCISALPEEVYDKNKFPLPSREELETISTLRRLHDFDPLMPVQDGLLGGEEVEGVYARRIVKAADLQTKPISCP